MITCLLLFTIILNSVSSDSNLKDLNVLNELSLEKLIRLKNAVHELVTPVYTNLSSTTPLYTEIFGSQAMALAGPVRRTDHDTGVHKKDEHEYNKISSIFSASVTTLAFLAFGGYLLCLIVQAVKSKSGYDMTQPTTFYVNSGVKKRPTTHFASYGRKRRDTDLDLPPEQLFKVLLDICEGYAKWSERNELNLFDIN